MIDFSAFSLTSSDCPPLDKEALTLAKVEGTIYHYEGIVDKEKYLDLFNEFKEIAEKSDFKCELLAKRFVKSYGPGLYHAVFDIKVYIK